MILDTSYLIDLMNGDEGALEKRQELEKADIPQSITSITLFELWSGLEQSERTEKEKQKIRDVIAGRIIYQLDPASSKKAGEIHGKLARDGEKIEPQDSMIAGIAVQENEPVLTRNQKHFDKIEHLKTENY